MAIAWVVVASILITETRVLQNLFGTVSLTLEQWGTCLVPGLILLALGEMLKLVLRARRQRAEPPATVTALPAAA